MNLLAEMVESKLGIDEWNATLEQAGVSGSYTALGLYEDQELLTLVGVISERTGLSSDDLVYQFGEFMFPSFNERYPELIEQSRDLLGFLETIDSMIHVEVKKLYPDAMTPSFNHQRIDENNLLLLYRSDRKMCRLAEGLIAGAGEYFNQKFVLTHEPCMLEGSDHCGLKISLS